MGITFEVVSADLDERFDPSLKGSEIPEFLSELKAQHFQHLYDEQTIIIASDTIVWMNDNALNKPQDREEALQMLQTLSGQTHEVFTAITLVMGKKKITRCDCTKVKFQKLTTEEINYYIDHHAPFDKAGSYGAQDFIGLIGIEHMEGSFYTVMGLPTHLLYNALKEIIL